MGVGEGGEEETETVREEKLGKTYIGISSERACQEEQNGTTFNSVAPSSEEL